MNGKLIAPGVWNLIPNGMAAAYLIVGEEKALLIDSGAGEVDVKAICEELGFDSLGYQSLDGLLEAIGLDRDKVCTYCWTGEED